MARDTRSRMIHGAALLVGTRGAASMSLRELAKEAGVPIGSTYHHFPGGKQQLVEEAVNYIGEGINRRIAESRERGSDATLGEFVDAWRKVLHDSDFRTGCPVLAVATEDDAALREVATKVFDSWHASLALGFTDGGVDDERASRLANLVVAAIEGAVALCRAEQSMQPLEDVTLELRHLFDALG